MQAEIAYFQYFLNFSLPAHCTRRGTYQAIIRMFRDNIKSPENKTMLRKIYGAIRSLATYKPMVYEGLYAHNYRALSVDLQEIVGSRLEN